MTWISLHLCGLILTGTGKTSLTMAKLQTKPNVITEQSGICVVTWICEGTLEFSSQIYRLLYWTIFKLYPNSAQSNLICSYISSCLSVLAIILCVNWYAQFEADYSRNLQSCNFILDASASTAEVSKISGTLYPHIANYWYMWLHCRKPEKNSFKDYVL